MNGIIVNYTFDTVAKTITLTDLASVDVKRVRFIKNLTTNAFIYTFTGALSITASGNVITCTGSLAGMSNSDILSIQYDEDVSLDTQKVQVTNFPGTQPISGSVSVSNFPSSTEISNDVGNPIPVSGTVTANTGLTQPLTDTQLRATAVPISGTVTANAGTGTMNVSIQNSSLPVTGTFWQATQPISAASLPLPTGAATAANQSTEITALNQLHTDLIAPLPAGSNTIGNVNVLGGNATAVKTDSSATTQPISASSLPLPTGAATAANQSTEITALNQIHTDLIAALPAGSNTIGSVNVLGGNATAVKVDGSAVTQPVSIASMPSTPVTGTFWQATQPVSGTVTANAGTNLNTSALALESGGNLASINTKIVQGQGASASAQLVTLANENIQDLYITGQSAQTATVNNIIPLTASANGTDLTGYRSGSVQIYCPAGTYTTGAIIFEGCNDSASGTNWQTIPVWNQLTLTGTPITAAITLVTTTAIVYTFPVTTRYVRVRISTAVSGDSASVQAFSRFSQTSWTPTVFQVAQSTAANLATSATIASGTVTTVSTLTTLANGQTAHSSASTGSPVRVGGRVLPTTIATVDATLAAGDASDAGITTGQQLSIKPFGTAELDYAINFSTVSTTTTVQPLVPASGTASVRNYISSIALETDTLGASGVAWILDSALTVSSIAITTGLVTTSAAHDLKVGDAVVFTALAAGTGVSTNTVYYVTSVGSTTTFNFATTIGGSNVVPSVAYTGTTMYRILYQKKFQTTSIGSPVNINFSTPLKGIANTALNFLIPSSLTSGNIYLTVNGYRGF